jgi:hypothetical protein
VNTAQDTDVVNELVNDALRSCSLDDGQLKMLEPAFLALGKRIHEAGDKQTWATAMIALSARLHALSGATHAAEQAASLAAIALGDVELNGMLCRKLYGRG